MSVQVLATTAPSTLSPLLPGSTTASTPTTTVDTLLKLCLLWSVLNKHEETYRRRVSLRGGDFLHELPPRVCNDFFYFQTTSRPDIDDDLLDESEVDEDATESDESLQSDGNTLRKNTLRKFSYKYSSRSLSVIGALGGIVFILFVVALSTCIKHRRELYLGETNDPTLREGGYSREILLGRIRHIRAAASAMSSSQRPPDRPDPPPRYDDVVKETYVPAPDSVEVCDGGQPPSYSEAIAASDAVAEQVVQDGRGVTTIQIS